MPGAPLPKIRLFPNDVVAPEMPVVLKEIELLEIDIVPAFCRPMPFDETSALSRPIWEPASPSTPAVVLPENTERAMATALAVAAATPKALLTEWTFSPSS